MKVKLNGIKGTLNGISDRDKGIEQIWVKQGFGAGLREKQWD